MRPFLTQVKWSACCRGVPYGGLYPPTETQSILILSMDMLYIRLLLILPMPRRINRRTRFRRRRRRRPRTRRRRRARLVLDPERKFIPFADDMTITSDGEVSFLNGAIQGTSIGQRQGMQHLNVSLVLQYRLTIAPTAVLEPQMVRLALIWYKNPRGAALDLADVWQAGGTAFAPQGLRDLEEALNYKVIWSRLHKMDLAHQIVTATVMRSMRRITRYSTIAGGFADVTSGSLWFAAISDRNVPQILPSVQFVTRVRFVG